MKFEYELNYDFKTKNLTFENTDLPGSLVGAKDIVKYDVDGEAWEIKSYYYPELDVRHRKIFLMGTDHGRRFILSDCDFSTAQAVAKALEKFSHWVENEYQKETIMTVAEIEKKLGVKNLKIVSEGTK